MANKRNRPRRLPATDSAETPPADTGRTLRKGAESLGVEAQYQVMIETSPDAIALCDFNGLVLMANQQLAKLHGYESPQELIGESALELFAPEERRRAAENLGRSREAEPAVSKKFEYILQRKDGLRFWGELFGKVIVSPLEKSPFLLTVVRDITERKRAEEALARQNALLSKLNNFSIELSKLTMDYNLEAFIAKRLKEITGATVAIFSEYNPKNRTLTAKHIEIEPGLLEKVVGLLGQKVNKIRSDVSEEMYHEMVSKIRGTRKTLFEATLGAISRSTGAAIKALLKADRFVLLAYLIDGDLYGTSMLVMRKDQPDLPGEILENFIFLASVSLRRKLAESQRAAALASLHENEERLKEAQRVGHLGSWDLNVGTGDLQWSDECYRIFGFRPQEFMPTYEKFRSIVHPEDLGFVQGRVDAALNNDEHYDVDFRFVRPNGEIGWIHCNGEIKRDAEGKPLRFFGTQIEITKRKQAEKELREKEEFLSLIIENMPDMIFIKDAEKLRFVRFNRAGEELLGATRKDMIGKSDYDLFPREQADFFTAKDRAVLESGHLSEILEEPIKTKHGLRILHTKKIPIPDPNGKPAFLLGISEDITERKRMESQREAAIEEVRRKTTELEEKNEDLNRFTRAVAHDLRSPLVTIQTFQAHLEKDLRNGNAARMEKDLGYIRNAADKMSRLLDEIRRLARVGLIVNPFEEASLQEIVQEALDLVAGRITARGVRIQVTEEPVGLYGDRTRLVEVFMNLVDNAVKFMGDEPAPRIEIGAEQAGDETVLFVRDNGIGIDPKLQSMIFGLFQKLDPDSEGEGIGLALVKRIVELHGGRIRVESEGPGRGATFRFTLAKTRPR